MVAGLPTLRVFGRAKAQAKSVGEVTGAYRRATLATLRLAFLSALVLELLATFSVALVAVAIGLRLEGGHLGLRTGLLVLVLAPEAYLPLRQLGESLSRERGRPCRRRGGVRRPGNVAGRGRWPARAPG